METVSLFVADDWAERFNRLGLLQPMLLEEYTDETMAALEQTGGDGELIEEVAAGSAVKRVELWRGCIGKHKDLNAEREEVVVGSLGYWAGDPIACCGVARGPADCGSSIDELGFGNHLTGTALDQSI